MTGLIRQVEEKTYIEQQEVRKMKTKIMLKYYDNAKQYIEQAETRTEIVFMDVTECTKYMEYTMIQTGLIIVAFYM